VELDLRPVRAGDAEVHAPRPERATDENRAPDGCAKSKSGDRTFLVCTAHRRGPCRRYLGGVMDIAGRGNGWPEVTIVESRGASSSPSGTTTAEINRPGEAAPLVHGGTEISYQFFSCLRSWKQGLRFPRHCEVSSTMRSTSGGIDELIAVTQSTNEARRRRLLETSRNESFRNSSRSFGQQADALPDTNVQAEGSRPSRTAAPIVIPTSR